MKNAWNIMSFLAVVNLLAMAMFVGWLWQSERLDRQRLHDLRDLFAMTIPQAEQAELDRQRQEREIQEALLEEDRRVRPPVASATRIAHLTRLEEIEQRTLRRIEQEKAMLRSQIAAAHAHLDEREAALEANQRRWNEMLDAERERRADEQFLKAVRQYESVRPRQGKEMLLELIDNNRMQQAVAYLDAMNPRAASKILGEFRTEEEIELATELLEQLRKFGLPPREPDRNGSGRAADPQEPGNAHALADAR